MCRSIPVLLLGAFALLAGSTAAADRPAQKHALLIGINTYEFSSSVSTFNIPTLQYADADVAKLSQSLERQNWIVDRSLRDRLATRENILIALSNYSSTLQPDDTFLIYFAGHGVKSASQRTYWLAWDTNPSRLDVKGMRLAHLLDFVADLPPKTKIVLLDHCYSGNLEYPSSGSVSADDTADSARSAGPGPAQPALRLNPPATNAREILPDDVLGNVATLRKHMVIIAAARGPAYESSEFGHGLFTYYLTQALDTGEADVDGPPDSQLTLHELVKYLTTKMKEYALRRNLQQEPFVPPPDGGDFATFAMLKLFSLPQDTNRHSTMERYLAQLATWVQPPRKWVKNDTLNQFAGLLGPWADAAGQTKPQNNLVLTAEDMSLIEELRSAVDGNVPREERTRALALEAKAAAVRNQARNSP